MIKKKIELRELGKAHTKDFLKQYHSFLRSEFRTVLKNELKSEKVLKELFGESETEFYKLEAVYAFQNI
jgi:hypothetical protein